MMEKISIWHNYSHVFRNLHLIGHCFKVLILVLWFFCPLPSPLPFSFIPVLLSLQAFLCLFKLPPCSSFVGSPHLSPSPFLFAAWPSPRSLHPPADAVLMALRPQVFNIYSSHASLPIYLYPRFASGFSMSLHPFPIVSSGLHEALRLML